MKTASLIAVLALTSLLAGCGSAAHETQKNYSPAPTSDAADQSAPPELTPHSIVTSFKDAGKCDGYIEIKPSGLSDLTGHACFYKENSRYANLVVGQAESTDEALEFAQSATQQLAALRIADSTLNSNDWIYSYDNGLIMTGSDGAADPYRNGNIAGFNIEKDVVLPLVREQQKRIVAALEDWHGRCAGSYGAAGSPFEVPAFGDSYDQCYTAGRLTETVLVRGWWQLSSYLDQQENLLQAPSEGPFYALVGDNWAVVDNVAGKADFEALKKELGGEVVNLMKFDSRNLTESRPGSTT